MKPVPVQNTPHTLSGLCCARWADRFQAKGLTLHAGFGVKVPYPLRDLDECRTSRQKCDATPFEAVFLLRVFWKLLGKMSCGGEEVVAAVMKQYTTGDNKMVMVWHHAHGWLRQVDLNDE